jgi:hypothetical protein
MPLRTISLMLLFSWFCRPGYSQNDFYQIYGPQDITLCTQETNFYGIETSVQLLRTTWTIIPDANADVVASDLTSASVQFFAPGTYILIASSLTVNQDSLTDSLFI